MKQAGPPRSRGERAAGRRKPSGATRRPQPRRYGRWRSASLIGVYLLMTAHIVHWRLAGRTLAPLELNEVMYTLEAGIITAGFIFMSLALLSVLIFGRFFCSWGCHILALQDLCAWLLKKVNIRPKPVRSRALLLVPVGAMLYMFVWPQVARVLAGQPAPAWRVQGDSAGWASFVTTDFWRNLPGAGVALLTFAVCGFAIVYLLGSRLFCTYACPYGAAFAIADRFAIGKIKVAPHLKGDRSACEDCGLCTAACESHIRVHTELTAFGKVVSPACLKDLDCVSVCPNGSITYGFTAPALFKSWRKFGRFGIRYDFTLLEDALMAAVFIACVLIFRGLYDLLPLLLSLAIGAIMAWATVMAVRLVTRRDVRFGRAQFKRDGGISASGMAFAAVMLAMAVFTTHSAFVHFHEAAGSRLLATIAPAMQAGDVASVDTHVLAQATRHLRFSERFGLLRSIPHTERLASALLWSERPGTARPVIERLLRAQPARHEWRVRLAATLLIEERAAEAVAHLQSVAAWTGGATDHVNRSACSSAHQMLGEIAQVLGDHAAAQREFAAAQAFRTPAAAPASSTPVSHSH